MKTYRVEAMASESETGERTWTPAARFPTTDEPRQMYYGAATALSLQDAQYTHQRVAGSRIVDELTGEVVACDLGDRVSAVVSALAKIADVRVSAVVSALAKIADVHVDDEDRAHITDYAPEATDGNTEPGSPWYEECDAKLAEIRAALPVGWSAEWSDNDVVITRDES